jgi:alkanesulfonate monooxygenase SsuD/methylene tetrahydromethanopterin reductase-like flavin-dependent oxidoreductase (luciferase family)
VVEQLATGERSVPAPFAAGSICYKPYVCDGTARDRIVDLLAQATTAEAAGFDGVTLSEHHLGFPGYLPNPLQAVAWVLERTERVWAAPAPLLALLRPVNLVVEEIAWLAAHHPGRVGLGLAAGAIRADFDFADASQDDLAARFERALVAITSTLAGAVAEEHRKDPALTELERAPVPVISAASSFTACRRAARAGCGMLLESAVAPDEITRMVDVYREAGGTGPVVLVRRAWIGRSPPVELERARDQLVRSTVPVYKRDAWMTPEDMILFGDNDAVAEKLVAVLDATGADALNLRVHVPGLDPAAVRDQIEALGPTLRRVRAALSTQ